MSLSSRNCILAATLSILLSPGCAEPKEPPAKKTRKSATVKTAPNFMDADYQELRKALEHLMSGAWEDADIRRVGELLAIWHEEGRDKSQLATAQLTYQKMRKARAERSARKLAFYVDDLRPGYSTQILDATEHALSIQDDLLAKAAADARAHAISLTIELAPQLAKLERTDVAKRALGEAQRLAPKDPQLAKLVKELGSDSKISERPAPARERRPVTRD